MKDSISRNSTAVYRIDNLDCAHCAAKIERIINEIPEVEKAVIIFATRHLQLTAENPDLLIPEITRVCSAVEDGIEFLPNNASEKESDCCKPHEDSDKNEIITVVLCTLAFILLYVLLCIAPERFTIPIAAAFIILYLILGGSVLKKAGKNILKGQIFDENFLMSIATLGAIAIAEYPEAVGVMLFFRIGELFEDIAVKRSRSKIMEAADLRPDTVSLVTADGVSVIDARLAKIGDILLVRAGDRIPLDGVVTDGSSRIDTSAVTGEHVPIAVSVGSKVISGCVNTSGTLKIRAEKELSDSMVTRILQSVENAAATKPKIDGFITSFSRVYTPIVVALALFTAIGIPLITSAEFYPWIYTALTFLVMSCPCALVLSVPLAYFCGIGSASKNGILFKGGLSLEVLSSVKAVVMDKTGTVTSGSFSVLGVEAFEGFSQDEVLSLCASCEATSTHPIAASIAAAAHGKPILPLGSVTELAGKGIIAEADNKKLLCGNRSLMKEHGIALAHLGNSTATEVILAINGVCAGRIIIGDSVKPDAKIAVSALKEKGLLCAMLTGDSRESANEAANIAGITEVYSGLMPEDKLEIMKKIREKHGKAMFVGDGINDAPVLAGSDVGAAMGSGTDAAIEAADVVFMNSDMSAIPNAVAIAKRTASISMQNVIFALFVKIVVMLLGISGIYSNMWLAVFADTGVLFLCILNSVRLLYNAASKA